ncbi:MAG: divalent-cation tolerance protein CutA [Fuerstiella sp.]
MSGMIRIHTTTATEDEAKRLAEVLLTRRLVACVQIHGPVVSSYWWESKLQESVEWTCTIKTLAAAWDRVEAAIRDVHSYDEPQIVATEVVYVSAGYRKWVEDSVDLNSPEP